MHLCLNLPTKWQTLIRMKYVLCSVRKGNTNNVMEKNGEILHIAGLLNSENPIQIQIQTFTEHVLLVKTSKGTPDPSTNFILGKGIT